MSAKIRTRQLASGKWVGEIKTWFLGRWWAVDAKNPRYGWGPRSVFYDCCQVDTQQEAETAVKNTLALHRCA